MSQPSLPQVASELRIHEAFSGRVFLFLLWLIDRVLIRSHWFAQKQVAAIINRTKLKWSIHFRRKTLSRVFFFLATVIVAKAESLLFRIHLAEPLSLEKKRSAWQRNSVCEANRLTTAAILFINWHVRNLTGPMELFKRKFRRYGECKNILYLAFPDSVARNLTIGSKVNQAIDYCFSF